MPLFYHTFYLKHFALNNYVWVQIFAERRVQQKRRYSILWWPHAEMPWMMMSTESGSAILTGFDAIFACRPIIKGIFSFYANQLSAPCRGVIVFRNGRPRLCPLTPDIARFLSNCVFCAAIADLTLLYSITHSHIINWRELQCGEPNLCFLWHISRLRQ